MDSHNLKSPVLEPSGGLMDSHNLKSPVLEPSGGPTDSHNLKSPVLEPSGASSFWMHWSVCWFCHAAAQIVRYLIKISRP